VKRATVDGTQDGAFASGRVIGFGTAAVDFRIDTADLGVGYLDKLLARDQQVLGGGATANCLVQVARLGGRASWIGKLGCDWIGDRIMSDLASEGVDCGGAIRSPSVCSPFNVAVYADGRRVGGYLLPNGLATLTPDEARRLAAESVSPGDWVAAEIGEIPLGTVLAFCVEARARGAAVMVDVDLDPVAQCIGGREAFDGICDAAAVIAPNHGAMRSAYPDCTAERLSRCMSADRNALTVVTAGADGAFACEPGERPVHVASHPVALVDTVGAGDAFHGGLLFALSRGRALADALALASRCGAAACTALGARGGMMSLA